MVGGAARQAKGRQAGTSSGGGSAAAVVPSRQQYLDLKAQHPRAILLYRLGDFYEAFDDDALTVARDARITLTSRSFGRSGRAPMAGIPHHALNHYLGRLLAAGHTVAIAEQVSEPGRGLVERAVTRVVTPGTVAEPALLPAAENRYLAAVLPAYERLGLAWVDVSTGEFAVMEFAGESAAARLSEELARLNPAECLVPDDQPPPAPLPGHQTRLEHWHFARPRAEAALCEQFGARSLAAYGCAELPAAIGAAGAILAYLARTNPSLLPLLTGLRTEQPGRHVGLDAATRRNLELTRGLRTGGSRGSLLGVLDITRTAMGGRALRRLLGQPLRDLAELSRRQAIVAALVDAPAARGALAAALARLGDLERLTGRITQGQAGAREFLQLAAALAALPAVVAPLAAGAPALAALAGDLDDCASVRALIEAAVVEREDGHATIRPGFWPALDAALAGSRETRHWLATLERRERERTGIRSLKVSYNKVFGYYIEVTRPNLGLVPAEYIRKQTVATGERFYTAALKEAEARILAADEEIAALERAALADLTARVTAHAGRLLATAGRLAQLDALLALAEVAARHGWTRPALDESDRLIITGGRHPVVEAGLAGEPFMPNDCALGGDGPRLLLVTGPNMGGKSTYLRQVALIVLLAQAGAFVPAASAHVGLVDRIFTRVGAQDDIATGQSTFMVEMVETAAILHQATDRSLVILDEVGRGTSTGDGLAIAQAVLEDLHDRVRARTLFATHYLELTALAGWGSRGAGAPGGRPHPSPLPSSGRGDASRPATVQASGDAPAPAPSLAEQERAGGEGDPSTPLLPRPAAPLAGVANVHVAALEADGRVIFLHAVRPGPADRSYGIHVARLAGLPPWVADRAAALANRHGEQGDAGAAGQGGLPGATAGSPVLPLPCSPAPPLPRQLPLAGFPAGPEPAARLAYALSELDLTELTPRQAIDWLFAQQERLRGGRCE
jgi:DNA mismatch repair protein MutS